MTRMAQPPKKSRGFTLIEALIAVVILAVGLISLAKFQTSLVESSGETKARTEAVNLAQSELEQVRNMNYADLGSGNLPTATITGTNAQFTPTWQLSDNAAQGYKTVTLTLAWTDKKGDYSVQLSSIISDAAAADSGDLLATGGGGGTTPSGDNGSSGSSGSSGGGDDGGSGDTGSSGDTGGSGSSGDNGSSGSSGDNGSSGSSGDNGSSGSSGDNGSSGSSGHGHGHH